MEKDLELLSIIILSIVQGITEFLPVSSTGHLILTSHLLGLSEGEFVKSFEIAIQLGSIFSIIVLYFRRLTGGILLWSKVLIAFIPTGILGFLFYRVIKHYLLGNPFIVVVSLTLGGIALIILELMHREKSTVEEPEDISYSRAFFYRALSVPIYGTRRLEGRGDYCGGLLLGLKRKTAVEFSFSLPFPQCLWQQVTTL